MSATLSNRYRAMRRSGMTLIEIMIVVTLMAVLMALVGVGFSVLGQADVSGESLRLSSTVRYTFNLAATSNMTLQMQIDFDDSTFHVQSLQLAGGLSDTELRGETMKSIESGSRRVSDRAGKLDDEDTRFGLVTRTTIEGDTFLSDEKTVLEDGVYFIGLMTSHHDEIQTEGVGTINFFANGFVERSVIYLGDEAAKNGLDEGVIYTVTINPLTGHSSVRPGRAEISSSFFEEEEDD